MMACVRSRAGRRFREAAGPIAVAVTSMAVLFALPFVALELMSSDSDEIRSRSLSPDGGREAQIVLRDRAIGLIGGVRFGVLRMRQTGEWSLRGWQDFAQVTASDPDRLRFGAEWTDERHLTLVIEGEARVSPIPPLVMGVAVALRQTGSEPMPRRSPAVP